MGLDSAAVSRCQRELRRAVDLDVLKAALAARLCRQVEVVARLPEKDTPGVVIIEDQHGNSIDCDDDAFEAAVTEAAGGAMSSEQQTLSDLKNATTVDQQVGAIRGWLEREVSNEANR